MSNFTNRIKKQVKDAMHDLSLDPRNGDKFVAFLKAEHAIKGELLARHPGEESRLFDFWQDRILDKATAEKLKKMHEMSGVMVWVPFLKDERFVAKFGATPDNVLFFENSEVGFASFRTAMQAFIAAQVQTPLAEAAKTMPHHRHQDPQLQTIAHVVRVPAPLAAQAAQVVAGLSEAERVLGEDAYKAAEAVAVRKLLSIAGLFAKAQLRGENPAPLHPPVDLSAVVQDKESYSPRVLDVTNSWHQGGM